MKETVKKFIEMVSADEKIKAELEEKLAGKDAGEQKELFLAIAKEKGFELEESDLVPEDMSGESNIDMKELSQVAGGGGCACVGGGGGGGDGLICICPVLGQGYVKGESISQGACFCTGAGAGATRRH